MSFVATSIIVFGLLLYVPNTLIFMYLHEPNTKLVRSLALDNQKNKIKIKITEELVEIILIKKLI